MLQFRPRITHDAKINFHIPYNTESSYYGKRNFRCACRRAGGINYRCYDIYCGFDHVLSKATEKSGKAVCKRIPATGCISTIRSAADQRLPRKANI
jgi:hypothetical protein